MQDWPRHRALLTLKRWVREGLWRALVLRARLSRTPRPAPLTGTAVLIDRCLGIGDLLMMSPALTLLEPLGTVTVVTGGPALLEWAGDWQRCASWAEQWRVLETLAARGRLVVAPRLGLGGLVRLLLRPALPAGVFGLDGRRWLCILPASPGPVSTSSVSTGSIPPGHYTESALAVAREALRLAGIAVPPNTAPPPRLPPRAAPPEALAALALPPGPRIVFAPWATSRIRRWPLAHWRTLAEHLLAAQPGLTILLLGSQDEHPHGAEVCAGLPQVFNLMGQLSLPESVRVIRESALVVACDNGIMHLGLGSGVPVLALFGSTAPATRLCLPGPAPAQAKAKALWEPESCPFKRAPCYPDLMRDPACPGNTECLSALTPDRVAREARELMELAG